MLEAINSTEIEPGQTLKFGDGTLEYEVLNVTRQPITNEVTSLVARRTTDGYTSQLALMLTAGIQPWRKYAAPVTSDEGSETPAPDEWSTVEEIRAAQQDAVKVELTRSETTERVRDLLLGDVITREDAEKRAAQEKVREERTRKAVAEAFLGKSIINNGRLVGTIVEASFTDDGLQVIAHKPSAPFGFDFNTTYGRGETRLPIPPSLLPRPVFAGRPGLSFHGLPDGNVSIDGRGLLTGVFGQGENESKTNMSYSSFTTRMPEAWGYEATPAKPEPTFTLAQLKSAVKKARKRARRSALREVLGFINNNLHPNGAQRSLLDMFFGKQAR